MLPIVAIHCKATSKIIYLQDGLVFSVAEGDILEFDVISPLGVLKVNAARGINYLQGTTTTRHITPCA